MSDELRDVLQNRADAIDVPSGDVAGVVAGGRGIKARRVAMAGAAGVVAIALVAWGSTGGRFLDRGFGEIADPGPTATQDADEIRGIVDLCGEAPFRPGYLPDGWDYVLGDGSGGQRDVPVDDQAPRAVGHWASRDSDDGGGAVPGYIDVYEYDGAPYPNVTDPEAIRVLGVDAVVGDNDEGFGVTFTFEGCRWVLNSFGPSRAELRRVAENLIPRRPCLGDDIDAVTSDGRIPDEPRVFGSIRAVNYNVLVLDRAAFLSGEEADRAAIEDGFIDAGESVPNDYYIDDPGGDTLALPIAREVEIELETYRHDGSVGLARWSLYDLICMLESDDAIVDSWFWLDVQNGVIARIEEQYVP